MLSFYVLILFLSGGLGCKVPGEGIFFKSQIWVIGEFPGNSLVIPRYFDFWEFFHPILDRVIEGHYPPRISDMGKIW